MLAAAFAIVAASAFATPSFDTSIEIDDGQASGDSYVLIGLIHSHNAKCIRNRTMQLFGIAADEKATLLDTAYSSKKGAWVLGSEKFFDYPGTRVKVTRKTIGRHGHRRICSGDSVPVI